MSTANKLTYLNGTKQAIKQAINEDFEVIDNNTTFREYADEISSNNAKYKDLIPKETKNATNTLDISNSSGLDKTLVTQYGNTYQETTTGKNKFYLEETTYGTGTGITMTKNEDGSYTFNGNVTGGVEEFRGSCILSENHTLSYKSNKTYRSGVFLRTRNNIQSSFGTIQDEISIANTSGQVTSNKSIECLAITFASGTSVSDFTIYPQLELGSTATDWEKYTGGNPAPNPDYPQTISNVTGTSTITIANSDSSQSQSYTINLGDIELCKIGTYKDRIYPLNGKWYLEKKIGKVVLNGSEDWQSYINAYNNLLTFRFKFEDIKSANQIYLLSNYFKNVTGADAVNGEFQNRYNNYYNLEFVYTDITSVPNFKTWLSTHNTIVYYILATPITTEITESNYPTLYNQLNNIKLYEGVNHITMTNESGLDVEFDITYYKDWKLD